jgi:hypothetical protein
MSISGRQVQRGVGVAILCFDLRTVIQQELHDIGMALRGRLVEWRPGMAIESTDAGAADEQ